MYELPTTLDVCGVAYAIRSDYRAALDICAALSDPDLSDQERAFVSLDILYPDFATMPQEHYHEAIKQCFWYINCGGGEQNRKAPKLMDWEKDFKCIVAPINRVIGTEVRAAAHLHWWTFIAAYYEIGECTFAQIVRIREQKSKGKALDKQDREWYNRNRDIVDLKTAYSERDRETFGKWGV